ncbi:hypothetical protein OBBRIDRAFT_840207 [Obba rivulosa]|uniref:Carbohydrate kinase FGGY C-terminal domain-containing protein n=1 Tax=Obba rivulosa TaxID=1052685 RepID=A0A8E2ARB9_9APHY|nr:hypothetical protein OBBRIDRAFT_840207 [Obba rivulosa]
MSKTPEYLSLAHTVPSLTSSHADTPATLALAVIPACDTPSLEDFRPYKDAVFPDRWMNEGGQSSTGQLIDFIVTIHPAYSQLQELVEERGISIHEVLHVELERLSAERHADSWTELLKDMHFYPDLHGHRDPRMRGSITGLTLDADLFKFALNAHTRGDHAADAAHHRHDEHRGARHAHVATLWRAGEEPAVQLLADTCRMAVVLPALPGAAVLLGAAMLGRFAHEAHDAGG